MNQDEQKSGIEYRILKAGILGVSFAMLAHFLASGEPAFAVGALIAGVIVHNFVSGIANPADPVFSPRGRNVDIEYSTQEFVVAAHLSLEDVDSFREELESFRDDISVMHEEAGRGRRDNVVDLGQRRRVG